MPPALTTATTTATGPEGLRPINQPRALLVETDDRARPRRVRFRRGRGASGAHAVERIDEVWRVVDEWWRLRSLARTYYRLNLDDGRPLTIFHDEIAGAWFEQRY